MLIGGRMCIEVADAEDDSLVESATSQKYFKRSIYLGLRGHQGADAPLKRGDPEGLGGL